MDYKDCIFDNASVAHTLGHQLETSATLLWLPQRSPVADVARLSKDENLDALYAQATEAENAIVSQMELLLNSWSEQAAFTNVLEQAQFVREANEKLRNATFDLPCNVWQKKNEYSDVLEYITNQTYSLRIRIYKTSERKWRVDKEVPIWYVSYHLSTNSFLGLKAQGRNEIIQSIDRKRFTDEAEMLKYVDGRKQHFSKYFKEDRPPIIREYAHPFKCNGVLLDGYTEVDKI